MTPKIKNYIRDGRSPIPKKAATSHTMSRIMAKNTKPERLLKMALVRAGVRGFRLHYKKVPGSPDICFPYKRLAVFVNGCYWHRCPLCIPANPKTHVRFWAKKFLRNVERDRRKTIELKKIGWKVVTIWECQLKRRHENLLIPTSALIAQIVHN